MRHQSLFGIAAGFAVFSLAFGLVERLWPALPARERPRPGFATDLSYWFFTPLVTKAVTRLAMIAGVLLIAAAAGVRLDKESVRAFVESRRTWASSLPVAAQALLALAVGDFFAYWQHRLFHGRTLWRFHAVHHGSTRLDWLSSVRLHPVNEILGRLAEVLPLIVLGFRPGVLAAYVPFLTVYAIFEHANVPWDLGPLRWVITTPRFHRWHHTSQEEGLDRNFAGLFPFWDLLFGTFYMPPGRQPERFGIRGEPVPEGLIAQLAYPFR